MTRKEWKRDWSYIREFRLIQTHRYVGFIVHHKNGIFRLNGRGSYLGLLDMVARFRTRELGPELSFADRESTVRCLLKHARQYRDNHVPTLP